MGVPNDEPVSTTDANEDATPTRSLTSDVKSKDGASPGPASPDAAGTAAPREQFVTGTKLVIIVAAVSFSSFIMLLDTMIVSTAIPAITDQFHSLPDVGWYASAYQFGIAAPQPLSGRIYKYFSTKWAFLSFFALFELGSALCGAAVSSPMLIVGRFVAGFGAAGISNGCLTILSSCVPLEKRPPLIGLSMGFNLLGIVVGPLLGGAFTQYASWRWCFYMNLPAGGLTMLALLFLNIPEQEAKPKVATLLPRLHHYLDIVGFLLFAPAVLMLLLALQFGGQAYPWSSAQVIGLFCGAAATIFIWFFWNRHRGNDAMLPHGLLGRLDVVASGVYIALLTSALYAGVYFLPIYFQGVNGATAMQSAVYLLPTILGQLFAAGAAGGAITKIGFVIPIAIFSTVLLSIGTGLYSILEPGSPNAQWIGFQILAGVGAGAGLQLPIINVQAATNSEELSSGIAFVLLSFNLGPAITLTLFNVLFLSSLQDQIRGDNLLRGIDPEAVLAVGATGFKSLVPEDQLERLLEVFSTSLNHVFYLAAALVAICSIVLWGMGWHDLRKKSTPEEDAEVVAVKDSEHLDEEKTASQL